MMKFNLKKWQWSGLVALAAFMMMAPSVSHAELTWQMLQNMSDLEGRLIDAKASGNTGSYSSLSTDADTACKAISRELSALSVVTTSNPFLAASFNANTGTCVYGIVSGTKVEPNDPLRNKLRGVQLRTPGDEDGVFSKIDYDEWRKKHEEAQAANQKMGVLEQLVSSIVKGLFNILASVLAAVCTAALYILNYIVISTTNTAAPKVVETTWGIVRDFMNLFFIISLIAMSLGTILRVEKYSVIANKRLLFNLITMAILINFSYVIASTLIGVSDTLMQLFIPGGGKVGIKALGGQIFSAFVWQGDITTTNFLGTEDASFWVSLGDSVSKVFALVFLAIAFLALSGLMFVRMIGLWFLLMLSPVAYALNILPRTQEYASMWWNTFTKYLIWGPVAMFFLNVSFAVVNQTLVPVGDGSGKFMNFLFIAGFVWAGFFVSKRAGMIGGQAIVASADKYFRSAPRGVMQTYGNLWARGTIPGVIGGAARGVSKIGAEGGFRKGYSEGYKNTKEGVGRFTAGFINTKNIVKEGLIDKPNKERKELVEKQQRRWELKMNYLKDFDKDNAGKVGDTDIDYLVNSNKVNVEKVRNIMESGNRKAKDRLFAHLVKGNIKRKKDGGTLEDNEYKEITNIVKLAKWKERNGKEFEMDEDFLFNHETLALNEEHVSFEAAKPEKLKEGEKPKDLKVEELKVTVPAHVVKDLINKSRTGKETAKTTPKVEVITSDIPAKEGTGAERQAARQAAAGEEPKTEDNKT